LRVAEVGTSNIAGTSLAKRLPLVVVGDVALPGGASRFDYQDVDPRLGHLVIAHMGDGSVLFVRLSDGAVLRELTGIRTPRGVAVAAEVGLVFVTSMPNQLVIIDGKAMREIRRVGTGAGPDGVAWDGMHKVVGVSNQRDGTLSLIHDAGQGAHAQVRLGSETGNVMFDATRGWFWVTVNTESQPDTLVAVNPTTAAIETTIKLPSCNGAHGLRLHPDAASAYVACESNSVLTRVDLRGKHAISTAPTGEDPDVMSLDPQIGWLYVAAESGELTVFDMNRPGVALIGHDRPFAHAHTVAADPTTHRVFFPLAAGPKGTPVLRIMQPSGL
jgi:DNA-binding beta-propeller fold protein YncE